MRNFGNEIADLQKIPANSAAFQRKMETLLFKAYEDGRESFGSAINMNGVYSPETPHLNRLFKDAIQDKEKAEELVTELNPLAIPSHHKTLYDKIQQQLQHKSFNPKDLSENFAALEFIYGNAAEIASPDIVNLAIEDGKKTVLGKSMSEALDSLKTDNFESVKNRVIENIPSDKEGNNVFISDNNGLDWLFSQFATPQENGALMPSALNDYPVANFRGDHTIIGGMSFGGKTTLMMSIVRDCILRNEPILIYSAEMTIQKLMITLIPMLSELKKSEIIGGNGLPLDRQQLLIEFTERIKNLIIIDATPSPTTAYLKQKTKHYSKIYKIQRVLLDYIQLVVGSGNDTQARFSNVAYTMKDIAKTYDIHCISLAQLSRSHTSRLGDEMYPRLTDLRESGAFEQSADEIIFIFLFELYKQFGYNSNDNPADGYLIWRKRRILDMPREEIEFIFEEGDKGMAVFKKKLADDDGSGFEEEPIFFQKELFPQQLNINLMNDKRNDGEIPF
jgi:hypothetical protein